MSKELIKAVREAVMRSTTTTRGHGITRNGYEPVVKRGKLNDCVKAIIHATRHLVDCGYCPHDFAEYLEISYEYHNDYHLYVFDKLPIFDSENNFPMAS